MQRTDQSAMWTAVPGEGEKVSYWLRGVDLANHALLNDSNGAHVQFGSPTYTETYDASVKSEVQFGVVFDWIRYQLSYYDGAAKVSSATCLYTNEIQLISRTAGGLTFGGWKSEDGAKVFQSGSICTGSSFGITNHNDEAVVKLTAVWTTNSYTVSFNVNGHGTAPTAKSVVWMQPYGDLPTLTCDGWAFDGWYTAQTGGTKVEATTTMTAAGDTTLHAHWTQLFTVVFQEDSRFGSTVISSNEIRRGGSATPPSTPVHEGYAFDRWTGWDGFSNVEQHRIYTATYTANQYVLTYHSNWGTVDETRGQDFAWHDYKAIMPNPFAHAGYDFCGWAQTANGAKVYSGTETVSGETVAMNPHLYALWSPINYHVRYAANGGDGEMADQELTYDVESSLNPCVFSRPGLEFKYWLGADGQKYADGQKVINLTDKADEPFVLTAVWSENYTLQFDANGATVTNAVMSPITFADAEERQVLPPVGYALPGYTFLGWATNRDEAAAWKWTYADQAEVFGLAQPAETITFSATWTNNTYTVKFDGGEGATGVMPDLTLVYDKPQDLPDLGFVREPSDIWSFIGWSNVVSGAVYLTNGVDRITVSNLTTEANGVVTLNAVWKSTLSELSLAMKCYNLQWESENDLWVPVPEGGYDGTSCAFTESTETWAFMTSYLTRTTANTNGVLRFFCKAESEGKVGVYGDNNLITNVQVGAWQEVVVDIRAHRRIDITRMGNGKFYIDRMTWTPAGEHPEPTDAPEISEVTSVEGGLGIVVGNARADYDYQLIGTNELTAPLPWPVLTNVTGQTGKLLLVAPVRKDEPQMFYRARVIQKQ